MLRHIIPVSLAMTACATLIPTKANAATLTILPVGEIAKRPGDSVEFIFSFSPRPSLQVTFLKLTPNFDGTELSLDLSKSSFSVQPNTTLNNTVTLARLVFDVITPVKNGIPDVLGIVDYQETDLSSGTPIGQFSAGARGADVVPIPEPVPEPLTMFGTAIGLGCGALFKRKFSKKTVS
jgi:hypothetical protein